MKYCFPVFYCILLSSPGATAQDASSLMKQIQFKLEKINDYEADARLKTQIPFLKVPDATVTVYYKKPDKIKIRNQNGISLVPRETVSISLY
ncbi:MAG TPA: hypothetical protein VIL90_07320, partial [Puia sp.]